MTTLERTQKLIATKFGLSNDELAPGRSLQSLGVDSLAVMELIFDIEDEFGIKVPLDKQDISTLRGLAELIDQQLAKKYTKAA